MKRSFDFVSEIDFGAMGWQRVNIDYSYDGNIPSLMTVYLMDGEHLGPEITDYLDGHGEDYVADLIARNLPIQLQEEAEYAAECAADAAREEQLMRGAA